MDNYRPVGAMPAMPPSYDGDDTPFEEFEIDDLDYETARPGFLARASHITKSLAAGFSTSVIHPVTKIIDPIYEGLSYLNMQTERAILKLGNPLVVKRLLYVLMMVLIIFLESRYEMNEGVTGSSGGTFSSGKFYDIAKLADTIADHIDPNMMKDNLEYLSSMPHMAGTAGDLALAKFVSRYMHNNGVESVGISDLESAMNYPKDSYVRMDGFEAKLDGAFNPNGLNSDELEAPAVFANFGTAADLEALRQHVDLQNTVLLVRYGGGVPEGTKVRAAQDAGAKAVVFLSPKTTDDTAVRYENVAYTRYSMGDVLTPGWASEDGYVTRLLWMKSPTTPKIPTVPVSYKDGEQLLAKLGAKGYKFGETFSGDGSTTIKLKVANEARLAQHFWNVEGHITGRDQPDQHIIIGAARDSVCRGTMSTNTGTVVMLELVKILTTMQRHFNWSPARSITFVSFDATEYNLAGSTAWLDETIEHQKIRGYTYVDLSDAVTGDNLEINANPFLHKIIKATLQNVKNADGSNMLDSYKKQNHNSVAISNNMIENKNYLPFINFANIPSVEIKFSGKEYPKNTCSDDFKNFEAANIDPDLAKHRQLVEILARMVLSLAEEPIIPFGFQEFVDRLLDYESDLEKFCKDAIDHQDKPAKPNMHYDGMIKALGNLRDSARVYEEWNYRWKEFIAQSADIEPSLLTMKRWKWNEGLVVFNEQFLMGKKTNPARASYYNTLFGPTKDAPSEDDKKWQWNTFPIIRDFINQGDFGRAQHEIDQLATVIQLASQQIVAY